MWVILPLPFVDRLTRGVAYDTLTEDLCGKGDVIDLYCEDYYDPDHDDYGLRLQDFRRPSLLVRVMEEE